MGNVQTQGRSGAALLRARTQCHRCGETEGSFWEEQAILGVESEKREKHRRSGRNVCYLEITGRKREVKEQDAFGS